MKDVTAAQSCAGSEAGRGPAGVSEVELLAEPGQAEVPFGIYSDGRLAYLRPGPDGQVLGGSSGPPDRISSRPESDR